MENPREMQVDELKLGHIAFGVNVSDLGGEIVRLVRGSGARLEPQRLSGNQYLSLYKSMCPFKHKILYSAFNVI